jgi:hypothetical protein
MADEARQMA